MDEQTPDPDLAALAEVVTINLRVMRVVAAISETEQRLVDHVKQGLPDQPADAASLEQATANGFAYDATVEAVGRATPHVTVLTQCCERLARVVRRTVALKRRIQAGWPGPHASADDRATLNLRHAVRATRARIRILAAGDQDTAERLFADLNARLDDPAFTGDLRDLPIREIIEALSRAIGLGPQKKAPPDTAAIAGFGKGPSPGFGRDPGGGRQQEK